MPDVLVGIGSNADPAHALRAAVAGLTRRFGPVRCSSVFRSAAVGGAAADYLNMVVGFASPASVGEIKAELRAIEAAAGRTRADPAVCALDLDLLFYGARVDGTERLPRPGAFEQPFVLVPLAELAPALAHPVTGEHSRAAAARLAPAELARLGEVTELA
jgi:2-amino-4-hydroxy-6-hydroxymethyldihydropteridine diphosphokinase